MSKIDAFCQSLFLSQFRTKYGFFSGRAKILGKLPIYEILLRNTVCKLHIRQIFFVHFCFYNTFLVGWSAKKITNIKSHSGNVLLLIKIILCFLYFSCKPARSRITSQCQVLNSQSFQFQWHCPESYWFENLQLKLFDWN